MERGNKCSIMASVSLFLLVIFFGSLTVYGEGSFSYQVEFPENQMAQDKGYYHLKMKPEQKQTVKIHFSNPGDKKAAVGISLNNAKTNSNGVIEYGDTKIENDPSLVFSFTDIVTGPKRIELEPGEKKVVELQIEMPETSYEGVIVGGIQLIQEGQENSKENQGSMVVNEYAYVVAMLLQESDKVVVPELVFNKVDPGQSNFKNTVFVNYSNVNASFVENMTTEVQISKKGSKAVIYERKQSKMRMAPNSFINFPVSMSGEKMVPGNYTAKILVTADQDIREEWTEDFTITKEDAEKFNERDVGLVQDKGMNWKIVVFIIVGFFVLVLMILGILTIIRGKKKNKKGKKRNKK